MPNIVLVGAQWGDEGKGKIVDVLAPHVGMVVRYQGGTTPATRSSSARRNSCSTSSPRGILHPGVRCVHRLRAWSSTPSR